MEVAKSVDDLMTLQSTERHACPDFEIFDAKISVCFEEDIRQISTRKTDCIDDLRTFFELAAPMTQPLTYLIQ